MDVVGGCVGVPLALSPRGEGGGDSGGPESGVYYWEQAKGEQMTYVYLSKLKIFDICSWIIWQESPVLVADPPPSNFHSFVTFSNIFIFLAVLMFSYGSISNICPQI